MSNELTYVTYAATEVGNGLSYTVNPDIETGTASLVPGQQLVQGDQFVADGQIFTYQGGADSGNVQEGFFATTASGAVVFFASTPLTPGSTPDTFTLNTSQGDTICFMAGTQIATPNGSINIEDLTAGHLVLTAEGNAAPVQWIGRQTVSTVFADPMRVMPIRIRAGALDEGLPTRDLLVSPCHAILVDGVLVQAGALVNGSTIVRETDVPTTFVYYHVALADHSLILAEGVAAETFVDHVDRLRFDNWVEQVDAQPELGTIKELPYARAASARQVPTAIIRRIASRVAAVAGPLRATG